MTIYDTCLDIISVFIRRFCMREFFLCTFFFMSSDIGSMQKLWRNKPFFKCGIFCSQNTFPSMGNSAKRLRCYLCVIIALLRHNRIHISYVPRITINFNGKIYCQIIRFSDMQTKEVGVNKINLIKCISCSTELNASTICKMC